VLLREKKRDRPQGQGLEQPAFTMVGYRCQQETDFVALENIGDERLGVSGLLRRKRQTFDVTMSNDEAIEPHQSCIVALPGEGRLSGAVEEQLDLTGRNSG